MISKETAIKIVETGKLLTSLNVDFEILVEDFKNSGEKKISTFLHAGYFIQELIPGNKKGNKHLPRTTFLSLTKETPGCFGLEGARYADMYAEINRLDVAIRRYMADEEGEKSDTQPLSEIEKKLIACFNAYRKEGADDDTENCLREAMAKFKESHKEIAQ